MRSTRTETPMNPIGRSVRSPDRTDEIRREPIIRQARMHGRDVEACRSAAPPPATIFEIRLSSSHRGIVRDRSDQADHRAVVMNIPSIRGWVK